MMKIKYEKLQMSQSDHRYKRWSKAYVYQYKIVDSIMKSHYKELMMISKMNKWDGYNTGVIKFADKEKFETLVEKIEKSNDKRCATSHKKAIEKKIKRKSVSSDCDHPDLGSMGYRHGAWVKCPFCGKMCEVW